VEDEETVRKIIDGFYYPPMGKRSLGGSNNWGEEIAKKEGKPYYKWWNENAILGLKLETVKGVLTARYLAKPGVTFFDFGGQDLRHDLMLRKHPGFESVDDCRAFVKKALQGKKVHF
jgi:2-keto-3-deoxy-L-rhamnonate aldolase RhmA